MSGNARGGLIGLFARHRTAANLLMTIMLLSGLVSTFIINKQFFPDFGIDIVVITVEWPGATAEDVDNNIVAAIEPEVRFLDGVKSVTANAYEGLASINVEFHPGHDMQQGHADVEQAVSQVMTLPEESERPKVRRAIRYDTVMRLVLSGPYPEAALKVVAKRIRDELLELGIDQVDLFGVRDEEIWVEVDEATLRRIDLDLGDIADRIAATSQDLPSGELAGGERQIRSLGLLRSAEAMQAIEVRALPDGRKLLLGQIARVSEAFETGTTTARRNGNPAVEIHVQRAVNADSLEIAARVREYLTGVRETLPGNLVLETYDREADYIRQRIDVLVYNGAGGLALVLILLFVVLNGRVALWVAAGIPTALFATIAVMLLSGQTINIISLFGLIMAIGIVVDDAIVVGEHAETLHARGGMDSLEAAIAGATHMAAPVFSSTLTTIAAFMPLFVIGGIMGQIMSALPFVVVAVLIASLVECFLVLPGHMRHSLDPRADSRVLRMLDAVAPGPVRLLRTTGERFTGFRRAFDTGFAHLRHHHFRRVVGHCIHWRYVTVACSLAAMLWAAGMVGSGRLAFDFFPVPEADRIYANVEMVAGTDRASTEAMIDELERAALAAADALGGAEDLVVLTLGKVGLPVGGAQRTVVAASDSVGGVVLELIPADERAVRTSEFINAWREQVRPVAGMQTLTIRGSRAGPPGRDVDVRLLGRSTDTLKQAAAEVRALLERFPGVGNVEDDLPWGPPETALTVNERGRALGFDTGSVGRQVRAAVEGRIAKRFPRGDEEVWVRVQYPRETVTTGLLDSLWLRAPGGAEVPLSEVVDMQTDRGFARIRREDGYRQVSVLADIDAGATTVDQVLNALLNEGLADIANRHGLRYRFAGRAEETGDTLADMQLGAGIGLALIFVILAWVFGSYWRPLVVMFIIPMGVIGAVAGHWILGYELSILSIFALLGLSGIVINDSIILVRTIDQRRQQQPLYEAIVDGSCDRFRAVLLTSATTIGGLSPLLFERSLQAQFLIPMAVTLVFGLALATLLVLLVVPSLVAIQGDMHTLSQRLQGRTGAGAPAGADSAPAGE